MGSRGPIRVETSRRGERERRKEKNRGGVIVHVPEKPEWLPLAAGDVWESVIADLEAAQVPLERIDGHAIALYVLAIHQTGVAVAASDTKLAARLSRDAIAWAGLIGATPTSRARLGIKPAMSPKPSKWDEI